MRKVLAVLVVVFMTMLPQVAFSWSYWCDMAAKYPNAHYTAMCVLEWARNTIFLDNGWSVW